MVSVRDGQCPAAASDQHLLQLSHLLVCGQLPRNFHGDILQLGEEEAGGAPRAW